MKITVHVIFGLGLMACVICLKVLPAGDRSDPAVAVNLGKVNTKADEVDPFLTRDGARLMYASNEPGTFDLMVSIRETHRSPWGKGINLQRFNTANADERSPLFLTKNSVLYFCSNKVLNPISKTPKNFDIFLREGPRAPFPMPLLNTKNDELSPWVALNGAEIYFSRKTEDTWRVYISRRPPIGGIGPAELVKELPAGFHHATLTPDGRTMYLQGPVAKNRTGLFRCKRARLGGAWSNPQPLVNVNNDQGKLGDMCPSLSADGRYLFFSSDRPGGQGGLDLWMVKTSALRTEN